MSDIASKKTKKGFTLIELIIVVALIIMFSALILPVGFNFYQESTLKDQAKTLENSLRRAQAMAITGRRESNAGVKIDEGQYTIFERESFGEPRPEVDITIPFPIALSATGPDEIVFQKLTGLPIFSEEEATTTITLKFGANSQKININSQGKIERYEENE